MEQGADWIDDPVALGGELAEIGAGPLAVDTEADSFHHYEAKLCLVQLSFHGRDLLLDPLALDLTALGPPFLDPRLRKVIHAADYDLRMIDRHLGLEMRGIFDTMIAARLCGERAFGLAALVQKFLGVTLDKRFQTADWSRRPMPQEMRAYAARDTRYLITLSEMLEARLGQLGRTAWAEEEFTRACTVGRTTVEGPRRAPYLRVKGAADLNRRELALLRALAELREDGAASADVPPFRIARDEVLLSLAREAVRGTWRGDGSRPAGFERNVATRVAAVVEAALAQGEQDWPPVIEAGRRPAVDPALEARVRHVCGGRDQVAQELDLDPTVIASRGQVEQALSAVVAGAEVPEGRRLRAWQAELLRPILDRVGG